MRLLLVDTHSFSYLRGLKQFDLLARLGLQIGKIAVTAAVIGELHRAGIGNQVEGLCAQGALRRFSPEKGDAVWDETQRILRHKDSRLVRRVRVDVELVAVARHEEAAVLTRETGIARLCRRRRVASTDLAGLFDLGIRVGVVSTEAVTAVLARWNTGAAAGLGCPEDWTGDLTTTLGARKDHEELLAELVASLSRARST